MISPVTGKLIHHLDCTYCVHRDAVKFKQKGALREREICALTQLTLPGPGENGRRCDLYSQINCNCEKCNPNIGALSLQMAQTLDAETVSW